MATKTIEKTGLMECRGRYHPDLNCNTPVDLNLFYDSWSPFNTMDAKSDKARPIKVCKLPYCENCIQKLYKAYRAEGRSAEECIYLLGALNNIPFIAEKVETTFAYIESEQKRKPNIKLDKIFGLYYGNLSREKSKHHLWVDFSCTDIDYKDIASHIDTRATTKKEMEHFELCWGKQDTVEDYMFLQDRYEEYTKNVEFSNEFHKDLYRDLCRDRLLLRKISEDRYNEEDITKVQTRVSSLSTQLKVNEFRANKPKTPSQLALFEKIKLVDENNVNEVYKHPTIQYDLNQIEKYEEDLVYRPTLKALINHRDYDLKMEDLEQYDIKQNRA